MGAVRQVPGRRGAARSPRRATGGCKGQRLGSGRARDKIPVDFGKARMSRRGDGAVPVSRAETGAECLAWGAPHTASYGDPSPSKSPFFSGRLYQTGSSS